MENKMKKSGDVDVIGYMLSGILMLGWVNNLWNVLVHFSFDYTTWTDFQILQMISIPVFPLGMIVGTFALDWPFM